MAVRRYLAAITVWAAYTVRPSLAREILAGCVIVWQHCQKYNYRHISSY